MGAQPFDCGYAIEKAIDFPTSDLISKGAEMKEIKLYGQNKVDQ